MKSLSHVRLSVTPWTAAHQAPPSVGFSRQEYWSGVPLPSQLLLTAKKRNCNTIIIAREFNTTLPTMDRDQTENQYGNSLNNIIDEMNLTNTYRIFYNVTAKYTSFKHTWNLFYNRPYIRPQNKSEQT